MKEGKWKKLHIWAKKSEREKKTRINRLMQTAVG